MNNEEKILEMLSGLTETMGKHGELLTELKTDVAGLKADVSELKTDVAGLKTDVSELKTDVAGLKTDVAVLQTDVEGLKTNVATLQTDVEGLKTNVATLQTDVEGLKTDVAGLKETVEALDARSLKSAVLLEADIPRSINRLYEGHGAIMEKLCTLASQDQVDEHDQDISIMKDAIKLLRLEVNELKKAQ